MLCRAHSPPIMHLRLFSRLLCHTASQKGAKTDHSESSCSSKQPFNALVCPTPATPAGYEAIARNCGVSPPAVSHCLLNGRELRPLTILAHATSPT